VILFLGFYFGALLMIILYNFHWYSITKEKSYLYYAFFKTAMVFMMLQQSQIIPSSQFFIVLNASVIFIFILLFSKTFLALKENFRSIDTLMNFMIYFVVFIFLYSVVTGDYDIFDQPYSLILLPFVIVGCYVYQKGFKPAKYYFIAWGISISFIAIDNLKNYGLIHLDTEMTFGLIGHIIESIILSYAIFAKTNLMVKENEEQSKILIHQAKLASMGQMLENISHQWRQPLNRISTFIINMQVYLNETYKDEKYLPNTLIQTQEQLEYMSNTINDFTDFNKRSKDKEHFFASLVIDSVLTIIGQTLEKNSIAFKIEIEEDFSIYSYPNELAQVLLNLIQNAQDVLMQREIKEPIISVIIRKNSISIDDNAGGIKADIVKQIFEPYFTTKSKSTSMGLGLYMSQLIVKKYFKATIELTQSNHRTSFNIVFN
jgi:signal transduction histidine kinase